MDNMLKGVLSAALIPLENELSVDHGWLASRGYLLLKNGCGKMAVWGTNGEANLINLAQRISNLQSLLDAGILCSKQMSSWAVELVGLDETQGVDLISLSTAPAHAPPSIG
jgi:hypothetical protein